MASWFITGSSRGLGRAIAEAALRSGDQVVATARNPEQLAGLVDQFGEQVATLELDVTDADEAAQALASGRDRFGRLDVIVNNAGYANVSAIETTPDHDFRMQFETNFWGVVHVSKAAIPLLRAQGGGLIMQVSSVGGRVGSSPGIASYQAAKFAVDGFSRVLAVETAPFGISVIVVEPSGFATDWAGSSMTIHDIPNEYQQTVGAMNARIRHSPQGPAGDPRRAAEILVRVAHSPHPPTHLLLGVTATEMSLNYSRRQIDEATSWEAVSRSADFGQPYPVDLPDFGTRA